MLLLSMFVQPKMGYVRGKIGLTGQFENWLYIFTNPNSRETICSPAVVAQRFVLVIDMNGQIVRYHD